MIYIEPRAGLCNRMRAIASAYYLASKFDTEITVLWRISEGVGCSYEKLFEKQDRIHVKEAGKIASVGFVLYALKCKKNIFGNINNVSERMEHALRDGENIYIYTCSQFYAFENLDFFVPKQEILDKANSILDQKTMYGIHIRRTDNAESIKYSSLKLFKKCINDILKKDKQALFYLATDSKKVENELLNSYGSHIIYNRNKEFGRKTEKSILDALIDLYCLKCCLKIYGSYYSSFSEIASVWGGSELVVVSSKDKNTENKQL